MNSIEQKLDEIEKKLDELKAEIKINSKTEDKPLTLRPNKDTPVNTIISFGIYSDLFFFKGGAEEGHVYIGKTLAADDHFQAAINDCTINIEEDLRFRLFLNAPEGYDWGAVDDDGVGFIYDKRPSVGNSSWDGIGSDYRDIGQFDQYKDIWKETLVRRKK